MDFLFYLEGYQYERLAIYKSSILESITHLFFGTKDMCIILLEPPHSGQTGKGTRKFITVDDSEIGNPPWELSVASLAVSKKQAVPWAVHRLESIFILLYFKSEHVFLVVLPMSTGFPEFCIIHIRCDDFLVSPFPVFLAEVFNESVVNPSAVW